MVTLAEGEMCTVGKVKSQVPVPETEFECMWPVYNPRVPANGKVVVVPGLMAEPELQGRKNPRSLVLPGILQLRDGTEKIEGVGRHRCGVQYNQKGAD